MGLSELEFQSHQQTNDRMTLPTIRPQSLQKGSNSFCEGRNTHLDYLSGGPLNDESLEYEPKAKSPDDKIMSRRKFKSYLMTDLNPIS